MSDSVQAGQIFRRLMGYVRPYSARLGLAVVLGVVGGGSVLAIFTFLRQNLAHLLNGPVTGFWQTVAMGLGIPLFFLIKGIAAYFAVVLVHWVGYRVVSDLRLAAFSHIQRLPMSFFSQQRSGEIISRIANDSTVVQQSVSIVVTDLVKEPFVLLGALAFVIMESVRVGAHYALVSLLVLPICILPVIRLGRKMRKYSRQNQEHLAGLLGVLQENTAGIRIVKTHCAEEVERNKFSAENERVFSRLMRMARTRFMNQPFMEILSALSVVLAFGYIKMSGLPVESFATIAGALVMAYQPVKKLGNVHMSIQQSASAAARLFEVMDTPVEIEDRPGAKDLPREVESIRFENVSYAYPGAEEPVLSNISLEIRAGECIALVGESGSGKTSLVNLLPRLFDPTSGCLRINGVDIRDYTLASLRGRMAMVTQDPFLFNATIADNIAYGAATVDMDRVREAARKAHAHDFIMGFPEGYDTVAGERGMRLSGGERQRIAVARAIYRDSAILILDEATSALDNKAERIVQEAIEETMVGRTSLVIAHRLSTVRNATRIVVMRKGGTIAEIGTHDELLRHNGVYRHLHDLQFGAFDPQGS